MILFGLGLGNIFLILLWSFVLIFLALSGHQQLTLRSSVVLASVLLSLALILLPQKSLTTTETIFKLPTFTNTKVLDDLFIVRVSTLFILAIFTVCCIGVTLLHCSEPMLASSLKKLTVAIHS